jgi:hypothetical protein
MKLLRLADMPPLMTGDRIYRYSRWRPIIPLLVFTAIFGSMIVLNRPPVFGPIFGLFGMLFVVVFSHFAAARFRRGSWLVRSSVDGLYINFRSYLATDYPADEQTVVFVAYNEINNAQIVKEHTRLPTTAGGGTELRFRTLLELHVEGETSEVQRAIAAEISERGPMVKKWYGQSSTSYDHHPVTFSNDVMMIEWGVVPSAKKLESRLGTRVYFEALRKESRDLRNLHTENRDVQESEMIRLVESGRAVDAVKLARKIHGFDLAQATEYLDGLRGSKDTTEGQLLRADEPIRSMQLHKTDADRLPRA